MQNGECVETAGMYRPWVLVVDDDPDTRTILSDLLHPLGFRLLLAEDGEQAQTLIYQHPLDLALLDIRLPGMSGLDLLVDLKWAAGQEPGAAHRQLPARKDWKGKDSLRAWARVRHPLVACRRNPVFGWLAQ